MDKLTSYIELTIPLPQSIPSTMIEEIIQKILTDICTTVPDYSYEIENDICKIHYTYNPNEE